MRLPVDVAEGRLNQFFGTDILFASLILLRMPDSKSRAGRNISVCNIGLAINIF